MPLAVGSALQTHGLGGNQQELPAVLYLEMCLVHTLPEARVCPSLGYFSHISSLPPALLPLTAHIRSMAVWVSWLSQGQNQQGFAAFTTASAQGQTKSGLRLEEEAGEMAQELHSTFA